LAIHSGGGNFDEIQDFENESRRAFNGLGF
jgi:hypothetical protein